MIIAAISFAVLAAVAAEFSYSTQVDLAMAANTRDDTRAYFLAKSGLGLARLMLSFQKQVDSIQLPPGLGPLLGGGGTNPLGGPAPDTNTPNQTPQGSGINLQLYKLIRVDCYMLQAMVPPETEDKARADLDKLRQVKTTPTSHSKKSTASSASEDAIADTDFELDKPQQKNFGGFDGCFDVKIDDPEETKINLHALDDPRVLPQALGALSSKEFEFLFDKDDANGVRLTPAELLINIHDWTDDDKVQSTIDLTQPLPMHPGFSDENSGYARQEPRYEAKNALFDSLDELNMIYGMDDRKMAAFRDRFTVYLGRNSTPNINTDDPFLLYNDILAVADPAKNPRLNDVMFITQLIQKIRLQRQFSFLGMSPQDFTNVLQANGLVLRAGAAQNISSKANTYTLHINASAGGVNKKVTAVVRMDQGALGRLVYWREE